MCWLRVGFLITGVNWVARAVILTSVTSNTSPAGVDVHVPKGQSRIKASSVHSYERPNESQEESIARFNKSQLWKHLSSSDWSNYWYYSLPSSFQFCLHRNSIWKIASESEAERVGREGRRGRSGDRQEAGEGHREEDTGRGRGSCCLSGRGSASTVMFMQQNSLQPATFLMNGDVMDQRSKRRRGRKGPLNHITRLIIHINLMR